MYISCFSSSTWRLIIYKRIKIILQRQIILLLTMKQKNIINPDILSIARKSDNKIRALKYNNNNDIELSLYITQKIY